MPAKPNYKVDYSCTGCRKPTTQSNRSKEFKERLCTPCYDEYVALDKKATAYLKDLRKHAPWSS